MKVLAGLCFYVHSFFYVLISCSNYMLDIADFRLACDIMREKKPLVVNITNYVAMTPSANALLAIGASPIMVMEPSEVEEIVEKSSALVLNLGVLECGQLEAMKLAAARADELDIPWALDPAGVGMSWFRTSAALKLLRAFRPAVIRGNASEIVTLALNLDESIQINTEEPITISASGGLDFKPAFESRVASMTNSDSSYSENTGSHYDTSDSHRSRRYKEERNKREFSCLFSEIDAELPSAEIDFQAKGVDSSIDSTMAIDYAKSLARMTGSVVSLSGATDYITDGERVVSISNGSSLMPRVTAMGCIASAITAAFLAVETSSSIVGIDEAGHHERAVKSSSKNVFSAAVNAMALMGVAGQRAQELCSQDYDSQIIYSGNTYAVNGSSSIGTGTFFVKFLDVLSTFEPSDIAGELEMSEI